jgi:hypothetical protein
MWFVWYIMNNACMWVTEVCVWKGWVCEFVCGYWQERILLKIDLGQRLKSWARFRYNSICTVVRYSWALWNVWISAVQLAVAHILLDRTVKAECAEGCGIPYRSYPSILAVKFTNSSLLFTGVCNMNYFVSNPRFIFAKLQCWEEPNNNGLTV